MRASKSSGYGRLDEREVFAQAIAETGTQDSYRVLNCYGVGSQGKSALLPEFQWIAATFNEAMASRRLEASDQ